MSPVSCKACSLVIEHVWPQSTSCYIYIYIFLLVSSLHSHSFILPLPDESRMDPFLKVWEFEIRPNQCVIVSFLFRVEQLRTPTCMRSTCRSRFSTCAFCDLDLTKELAVCITYSHSCKNVLKRGKEVLFQKEHGIILENGSENFSNPVSRKHKKW